MSYTAVFERDPDGRWTVDVPEVQGCHSYGRTIEQARERVREALALFVDDAETADIKDEVRLPRDLTRQIQVARDLRQRVARDEETMVTAQVKVVAALRKMNLGHRDAGHLLGLSFQRVHQLEKRGAHRSATKRAAKKR
jgi:predicted RNase H-like HicB family nuclease